MGTLAQKLQYTLDSIDDIQKALEEKGFNMSNVELFKYGALIRLITSSSGSGGSGSSTGNEGQPLGGLKVDNAMFISKSIQNIAMKDISFNGFVTIKSIQILNNNELATYEYPWLLDGTYILQKDILYENTLNITDNITMLSKEIIHVNIDNIIEQEG